MHIICIYILLKLVWILALALLNILNSMRTDLVFLRVNTRLVVWGCFMSADIATPPSTSPLSIPRSGFNLTQARVCTFDK